MGETITRHWLKVGLKACLKMATPIPPLDSFVRWGV
jgi:hypothetical protein